MFKLIKIEDTAKNLNSEYGLTPQVQDGMANGNTQFILQLSRQFKYGYTIPAIALQIASRFFHIRSYINHDRYVILVSCLIIAAKFRDMEVNLKKLCFCTFTVIDRRVNNLSKPHNQSQLAKLRQCICIAQAEILRTMDFQIDCTSPHDYVKKYSEMSYYGKMKRKDQQYSKFIFDLTRIIIMDSYRAQCSLYFSPLTIFLSCFLIASQYEKLKPFQFLKQEECNQEKSDEELYQIWLKKICCLEGQQLEQQTILECIKRLNHIIGVEDPINAN